MNLTIVLEGLQDDLQRLAELGDERSEQIARRLGEALGSNLRLKLLDLLSQAALELNAKLPSGHIEVRLAGQEPELVFVDAPGDGAGQVGEELSARISLRLPDSLKASVERSAAREGVSTNAWLIRAIARATESRPVQVSGKRLSGYAQS
ncbi:MAG: toxin-antitoxin system HicB family antitoxin [Actinobacteria bacterium]|nr:toxin-antitoxin system HicB family antitoxin [Actinomycetota bacterium]